MADDGDLPNKPKTHRTSQETFHRAQEAQVEHKFPYNSTGVVNLPPGSRGPRSLYLKRHGDSFGFTLRHFIVYPPDVLTSTGNDARHAAVGALSTPMDTIFVKHVKDRSPAKLAGLQCGDRLVAINRIPVTDKSYSQVIHLIQNSPDYLHLLVVPKEEDILQRFFAETAYNPASNQQNSDLLLPNDRHTTAQRFLTQTFNQRPGEFQVDAISWRSLQNPYHHDDSRDSSIILDNKNPSVTYGRGQKSADNLHNYYSEDDRRNNRLPQGIYVEINPNEIKHREKSRAQPQVPLYRKMGRRASDGCALLLSDRETYYDCPPDCSNSSINSDPDDMIVGGNNNNNNNKMKAVYKPNYLQSVNMSSSSSQQNAAAAADLMPAAALRYPNIAGCRLSLDAGRRRESSSSLSSSSLVDGSKDSLNSFDSTSTLTGHETDDSAIMTRYRKNFQQKEEFLKMPNNNLNNIDATLIQREFYGRPKKLDKSMWPPPNEQESSSSPSRNNKPTHHHFQRVKNDIETERDLILQMHHHNNNGNYSQLISPSLTSNASARSSKDKSFMMNLNQIQEISSAPSGLDEFNNDESYLTIDDDGVFVDDKRMYPQNFQIVIKRAKQFESGTAIPDDDPLLSNRTSFYRSELARLSSKRVVPNVTERAQEYEILTANEPKRDNSGTSMNSTGSSSTLKQKLLQRDGRSLDSSDDLLVNQTANKIRARSNSAESWVAALRTDKKPENNKKTIINRQDAILIDDDGNKSNDRKNANKNNNNDISMQISYNNNNNRIINNKNQVSPLIPEPVEHIQLAPIVSITPAAPSLVVAPNNNNNNKAVRPTQLDLEGPIRPSRHLKPPSSEIDTPLYRPISPAEDERAMRRESYLKATETGRMHFDSDLSDGDISPHALRSAHRRWRPPMFPGDIQQLRKLFEDAASSLGGSVSGNSSSSVSLDREKGTSSPLIVDKFNIIKEGLLYCKITEIDGKRAGDRSWKQILVSLRGPKLFLLKDIKQHHQSPLGTSDAVEHSLSSGVDMRASVVRVAEDYTKRKHVLRVSSVNPCRSEFLLQAENTEELADWVNALQEQMATTTDVEAKYDLLNDTKQQAVPQTIPALTSIQVQGSSRLSPQPPTTNNKSSKISSSQRNRSPTGQSPVSKTRKPSSSSSSVTAQVTGHNNEAASTSPKSKTWRGRVAKQFRKIHQGANSPNSPTAPEGSTFGIPLDHCLMSHTNPYVPLFVDICTNIVDARGLQTVGIYRVPGNNASITALTDEINRNYVDISLDDPRWNDLHVVSSLLKSYFRKMPDSLVTNALYRSFIKAARIDDCELRMKELKRLVKNLSPHNYHTLKHIILHLKRVVDNCDTNKMDAKNLAIVFGPTIVRPEEENMENMVNNMTNQYKIVETLLTCSDWFFSDNESDTLPIPTALPDIHDDSEPVNNQALLLDNISKYEAALKDKEKNGALFSSIISAAQRKVKRKVTSNKGSSSLNDNKDDVIISPQIPNNNNNSSSSQTFSFNDLKESTTTTATSSGSTTTDGGVKSRGGGGVIPTTVTDMEKIHHNNKQQSDKVPWFNYSTDQEDFHRRIENFELETKAMLQMPRNLEISVVNNNIATSNKPSTTLSSSASNVNQTTATLGLGNNNNNNNKLPTDYLTKTHSASNVFSRTALVDDDGRNSLNSVIKDNNSKFSNNNNNNSSVQYNNNNKKIIKQNKSDNNNKYKNNNIISDLRSNNNRQQNKYFTSDSCSSGTGTSSRSTFPSSIIMSDKNNGTNNNNNNNMSDMRRSGRQHHSTLRRGSSVENLNSSSIDLTNANCGTMKKVKYENEGDSINPRSGSLDSLNKLISVADDEIDLVTSLTKLYDKKLKEEKKQSQATNLLLLAGEGLPYVDESPEKLPRNNNITSGTITKTKATTTVGGGATASTTLVTNSSSLIVNKENKFKPNLNDLYRNPSLHKKQFTNNNNNNNNNNTKVLHNNNNNNKMDELKEEECCSKDMDKDEDSTMMMRMVSETTRSINNVPDTKNDDDNNRRISSSSNKILIKSKNNNNGSKILKRSESLTKTDRSSTASSNNTNNNVKLKRSDSLNKAAAAAGAGTENKLKRSDSSLTKNEKTENNLNKRRELTTTTTITSMKLKRKNGMPDRSIKRRHTVGGTKDPDKITWLDNNKYDAGGDNTLLSHHHPNDNNSNDSDCMTNKEKNLRTSSPDLSSTRRERLLFEINLIGPENMVVALRQHLIGGARPQSFPETAVFNVPLESHV